MSSSPDTAHENRLARETSPYLLQHKHNPVDWWPWGTEALAEAKRANKPILLSVGYAACHWCHVMAHESFEDAGNRRRHERTLRQHQSRPRGAPRHRPDLHVGAAPSRASTAAGRSPCSSRRMASRSGAAPIFPKPRATANPPSSTSCARSSASFRHEPQSVEQNRSALMARLAESARPAGRVVDRPPRNSTAPPIRSPA